MSSNRQKLKFKMCIYLYSLILLFLTQIPTQQLDNSVTDNLSINPFIYEVSMNANQYVKPELSLAGGNILHIKGGNFDTTAANNNIKFGSYPCVPLNEGIMDTSISCRMSEPFDPNLLYNIPASIIVGSSDNVTCSNSLCLISFIQWKTPILQQIAPRNVHGDQQINFIGIHKIKTLGDGRSFGQGQVERLFIGDKTCSMIDVINKDQIQANLRQPIACNTFKNGQAGQYQVSQYVFLGKARNSLRMTSASLFTKSSYEARVLPYITKLSTNKGSENGNIIDIQGSGFSSNILNYGCQIYGQQCKVISADKNNVKVQAPAYDSSFNKGEFSPNNFIKGNGFQYKKFMYQENIYLESIDVTQLRDGSFKSNDPQIKVLSKITTQLASAEVSEQGYSTQFLRGYFYAPVTGKYAFSVLADDQISVKMSSVSNSSDPANLQNSPSLNLKQNSYTRSKFLPFLNPNNDQSLIRQETTIQLAKDNYYYMEVIAVNTGGVGYFKVQVETPNLQADYNATTNPNPQWQLNKISLTHGTDSVSNQSEVIEFNLSTLTKFRLQYLNYQSLQYSIVHTDQLDVATATASQIQDQMSKLPYYNMYSPLVTYANSIISIQYVKFRKSMPIPGDNLQVNGTDINNAIITIPFTRRLTHGGPLQGTYALQIDGVSIKVNGLQTINYNTPSWDLQYAINSLLKSTNPEAEVNVQQVMLTNFEDQISFIIQFVGVRKPLSLLINKDLLTQNNPSGPRPTIDNSLKYRDFDGSKSLFNPVTYDFLKFSSNKPSLLLTVNQIPALVQAVSTNDYQFDSTFNYNINAWSINQVTKRLTFTLSSQVDVSNINFAIIAGSSCLNIQNGVGTNQYFCDLNNLNAGTNVKPKVSINKLGFAGVAGISTANVSLVLNANNPIQPAQGNFGGTIGTIYGSGFKYIDSLSNYHNENTLQVMICGFNVTNILQISNDQSNAKISFIFPQFIGINNCIGRQTLIKYAGQQISITYIYDSNNNPNILSISPTSASPIIKGPISIVGSSFSSISTSKPQVFLRNYTSDQKEFNLEYQLTVTSFNDTNIQAILGGGRSNTKLSQHYTLVVKVNGKGIAKFSNQFQYATFIQNIQPKQGPLYGGFNLTITGKNFLNTQAGKSSSLNVFIGLKQMCKILSQTNTQIVCKMPSQIQNGPYPVTLTSRIVEESICNGNCTFTYKDGQKLALKLTQGNLLNAQADQQFTLQPNSTLSIINSNDFSASVLIDGNAILSNFSGTSINFKYPGVSYGYHQIKVSFNLLNSNLYQSTSIKANNFYYSNVFIAKTQASIVGYTLQDGFLLGSTWQGSTAGHILAIKGNGLPKNSGTQLFQICDGGLKQNLNVLVANYTHILFQLPPHSNGVKCVITFTYKYGQQQNEKIQANPFTYTYNSSYFVSKSIVFDQSLDMISISQGDAPISLSLAIFDSNNQFTSSVYPMFKNHTDSSNISYYLPVSNAKLPTLKLGVKFSTLRGYANVANITKGSISSNLLSSNVLSSYVGKQITISGVQFIDNGHNMQNNQIKVCGSKATIISVGNQQLTFQVPNYVTKDIQAQYNILHDSLISGNIFSDSNFSNPNYSFDNQLGTFYSSSNLTSCQIGINFDQSTLVDISKIRFMPNVQWTQLVSDRMKDGKFMGKDETDNWVEIFVVDQSRVHIGWNVELQSTSTLYKGIKFTQNYIDAATYSNCQLASIQVYGKSYSTSTDGNCSVQIAGVLQTNTIQYKLTETPIITSVLNSQASSKSFGKPYGKSAGSEQITIFGSNLLAALSDISITIDGIECSVISGQITATEIKCLTGRRPSIPASGNSFQVKINQNRALLNGAKPFRYVDRFSDSETWQGQTPPRNGDSLYVPKGQTLLVDDDAIRLNAVIIEGQIIFQNGNISDDPLLFEANYFVLNQGSSFQAGTEEQPYLRNLTITMYGDYYDKQLPTFGNKGIGCRNCKFSMYGRPITYTWTQLLSTANKDDQSIIVIDNVCDNTNNNGWRVGDQIVIASTSIYHAESEMKKITGINIINGFCQVQFANQPLKYEHISIKQIYDGGRQVIMRAEVGLLSRNIVMQGDPEYQKSGLKHGSHLLLTGKQNQGLIGHIAYSEFRFCGQPKIVARYCTHFHMAGQVPSSYVKGNAVHHSHARVLTIHGTHYLTVEKNVGYLVEGHNYFVEDGIETNNVIQDNLAVSSLQSFTMTQSDITVASFWITNPYNIVRRNHAAGGDFYGFWYEVMQHPTGPSATQDICPMGMKVQQSRDNVAHSNFRFGLRIFKLSSRMNPCQDTRNTNSGEPYDDNTAIKSVFENYTLWRNQQSGFLGQKLGYMDIKNFNAIDNIKGGLQFHKTNFTHPIREPVTAKDSLVVGLSKNMYQKIYNSTYPNAPTDANVKNLALHNLYNGINQQQGIISHLHLKGTRGLFAPRTNGFVADGIHFENFYFKMTPFQSCSQCWHFKLWVVGSKSSQFKNISYTNVFGNYIYWQNWRRQIFIGDGSLLNGQTVAGNTYTDNDQIQITPYRANLLNPSSIANNLVMLNQQSGCYYTNDSTNSDFQLFNQKWDNAVICDNSNSQTLRSIIFVGAEPKLDFKGVDLRITQLRNLNESVDSTHLSYFGTANQIVIKPPSNDIPGAFSMPVRTGKIYNVHWKEGIDFSSISIGPSPYWGPNERVLLRFNYSDTRQQFLVNRLIGDRNNGSNILQSLECNLNGNTLGQYFAEINKQNEKDQNGTQLLDDFGNTIINQTSPYYPYNCSFYTNITQAPPCKNGQYINDRGNRMFILCVSGDSQHNKTQIVNNVASSSLVQEQKTIDEWITVVGNRCHSNKTLSNCIIKSDQVDQSAILWTSYKLWPQNIEIYPDLTQNQIDNQDYYIAGVTNVNQTRNGFEKNATIQSKYHVIVNIPYIKVNFLIIDGTLQFGDVNSPIAVANQDIKLQANYIWVRGINSQFLIGKKDIPFLNKAVIVLNGNKNDRYLTINNEASGNKMLSVTGSLQFYGIQPSVSWTKLKKIAKVDDLSIQLIQNVSDWKAGDQIVLASTYSNKAQHQKKVITAINSNIVTLSTSLSYEHYGAVDVTAQRTNSPGSAPLDTRGGVGLLSRNIKVTNGSDPNNWGCRILVAQYLDSSDPTNIRVLRGRIKMQGVQVNGCGQYDSTMAGIRLQNVGKNDNAYTTIQQGIQEPVPHFLTYNRTIYTQDQQMRYKNIIVNSSIHTCNGYCFYIDDYSRDIHVDNNVLYHAERQIVYVGIVRDYNFTNNLLIYAHKRQQLTATLAQVHLTEDVACYQQHKEVLDISTANIRVQYNLAQGSEGQGFVFPLAPCKDIPIYPFVKNTAGSCQISFMYEKLYEVQPQCIGARSMTGYASEVGLQANPPGGWIRLVYEDAFFADNRRGITLRYAHQIDDNTCWLKNSEFYGFSRKDQPDIYADTKNQYCRGGYAIRGFTATISGQTFPLKKPAMVHDIICTQQAFDFKAFLTNVKFHNYLWESNPVKGPEYCQKMSILMRHSAASDGTAPHYLQNSTCQNCDEQAFMNIAQPSAMWAGWFGGCGTMDCTGPDNVILHDTDGNFTMTGIPHQIYGRGQHQHGNTDRIQCRKMKFTETYICRDEQLVLLQYQSQAVDKQKRIIWPIQIYDYQKWKGVGALGSNGSPVDFYSLTNGWKQWKWDGPQPMNLRLSRFWSVIRHNRTYNVTYASQPPKDTIYQLNRRAPAKDPIPGPFQYSVLLVYYPLPNSIQIVSTTNNTQRMIDSLVNVQQSAANLHQDPNIYPNRTQATLKQVCGANNFHYKNGTIQFVVNSRDNCQVRVRLTDFIQISARIDVPFFSFYQNKQTSFISNIAAFLNIDPGRLKILGLREGSTVVDFIIKYQPSDDQTVQVQRAKQLKQTLGKLVQALLNQNIDVGGIVLDASGVYGVVANDGTVYTLQQQDSTLIIILATTIPLTVIIIVGIIIGYCCYRRRRVKIASDDSFAEINSSSGSNEGKPTRDFIKVQDIKKLQFDLDDQNENESDMRI